MQQNSGYLTVPLSAAYQKAVFHCGKPMLDNYLKMQAQQDVKKQLAACFITTQEKTITGYYTLSNTSISNVIVPEQLRKKFPSSYDRIPATLMGRLAVDLQFAKKGLGKLLLVDALKRSYQASLNMGSIAIIVDPLDEEAIAFYLKYGFITLPDSGKMFLAMKTVAESLD